MATGFSVWGASQKQIAYAKDIIHEAIKEAYVSKYMGPGINNVFQERSEIHKQKGDKMMFDLLIEFSASPRTGHDERTGNEEKMTMYTDDVLLDSTWHGFVKYGRLDDEYSVKNMLSEAKQMNKQYFQNLLNEYCTKWLCGNTSLGWPESVAAHATSRIKFGGNATISTWTAGTSDIATGDYMGAREVSYIKYHTIQADPKFKPLNVEGGNYWVLFAHPRQIFSLKQDSTFQNAQRDAFPRASTNPLFTGAVGMWDGVIISSNEHILTGNSNTEARAVLAGQQAAMVAMGPAPLATEEHTNHMDRHAVGIEWVWGIKRSVFNSVDFGSMALDTYAAAPAGVAHT